MPINIIGGLNDIGTSLLESRTIMSIASNPIITAMIVVVTMMIITAFMFRDVESDESVTTMTLRSGFWAFFAVIGVLFLHNKVLLMSNKGAPTQLTTSGDYFGQGQFTFDSDGVDKFEY